MIVFAIPLRAKATTNNWDNCVLDFSNTIRSIFNQTCDEFRVIVACHDVPALSEAYDERLEFIPVTTPIPSCHIEYCRDKFWKLSVIGDRIRRLILENGWSGGVYVMPVDADDLLNRHIAAWCVDHPDEFGAVSRDGYVWNKNKRFLTIYKQMHTYCGSCNIIRMNLEDLPENVSLSSELALDKETAGIMNARYPLRFNHNEMVEKYKKQGKPFAVLPFRSTIYVTATGENISGNGNKKEKDRFHPVAFVRSLNPFQYHLITGKVKKDFGIAGHRQDTGTVLLSCRRTVPMSYGVCYTGILQRHHQR